MISIKTIYELTNKEGKKIDSKLKRTNYFKQFCNCYYISILIFVAGITGYEFAIFDSKNTLVSVDARYIVWGIFLGVISILTFLLCIKRFELAKDLHKNSSVKE